ncbi:MAG: hypothetical protein IPG72_03645 [Ardenticatenales bacterium]|nr:hypothetical protein [Ardenticatenales bacterium]
MLPVAIARQSFRRHLTYRTVALAGLATNFFFGMLRVAVITALYDGRSEAAGITLPAAITFTAISQAVIGPLAAFGWFDVMRSVHTGEIAGDLLRPMGYIAYWLANDFGRAATQFILRGVPMLIGYVALFPLIAPAGTRFVWPHGTAMWAASGACFVLAWLISFGWRFVANLSAFWSHPRTEGDRQDPAPLTGQGSRRSRRPVGDRAAGGRCGERSGERCGMIAADGRADGRGQP